jgi:multiple sugar transport system substrate-binding protein
MKRRDMLMAGVLGGLSIGSRPALAQAQASIRFLTPETDPSQVKVWQELIVKYGETNKGTTIRPEYASWDDLIRKIPADLMAGTPPEIVAGSSRGSFMAAAAKRNLLVDLAPLVDQLGRADFHAPSLKAWNFNGIQAAIPYGVQWPVLWCRTDMFQEAGLPLPKTWDEYRTAAERLTNPTKGIYGACFPAGRTWNTQIQTTIAIWGAGGLIFDDKLNPTLDTPEVRRAMTYYADMCRFSPPDIGQYGFREASAAYTSGKSATTFYWGRVLAHLYQQAPDLIPKSRTVHIPHGGTPATAIGWDEFVVYKSRNNRAAMDYVKFMLEPQQMFMLMQPVIAHVVPTRNSVLPMLQQHDWIQKNPDIVKPLIDPIEFGFSATQETENRPFNYKWDAIEARNILPDMVQRIVLGKEPIALAVQKAQKDAVDATKDLKP